MSGIEVDDACVNAYNSLKMGKNVRYVEMKMNDTLTSVVVAKEVAKKGDITAEYKEFLEQLPANEARYFIYDFEFTNADNDIRNKVAFILWAPDSASIKGKMIYTSTKDSVKKKLQGLQVEVQATDYDEISYESVLGRCQK
eukprot:TRINITY_DN48_c0_g3_i1.p1 TRINITY_DN48_c0_g3~~TRINITY_DN48_c0_g3_i1.p1  ORF type:complete len:141 (-),score=38.14 TRINITY_DN48_c0_g3_i1:77-499(-)